MNVVSKCAVALLGLSGLFGGCFLGARSLRALVPAEEVAARLSQRLPDEAAGVLSDISATSREVVVSFLIPGLKAESLSVTVDEFRMSISCLAGMVLERSGAGGSSRGEAVRRYDMFMPLPADVDAGRHRVIQAGESFKVIFEKRADPALNF